MKREIVRLQKIELRNLKNVGYGCVKFATKNSVAADILGLYGQNGSGKTTLVNAIDVLKDLLMGKRLAQDLGNYIKIGESTAGATVEFSVTSSEDDLYKVIYEFVLVRKAVDDEEHIEENNDIDEEEHEKRNGTYLVSEKISMSRLINDKWTKLTPILYYNSDSNEILPKNRYNLLTEGKQELIDELRVLRLLAAKEERSFLFSKEIRKIIRDSKWKDEYKFIFKVLTEYAIYNLHVFSSEDTGMINANIALPFSIVSKEKDRISLLKGCLNLNEIIPGLTINLKKLSTSLNKRGEEIVKAEIIAKRANIEIPLRYESDGVKKLVSILYCLILVFNDSSMTLVVDEFDSGIFEYLLGEILRVVEESGKGQLIFTSHNLRALEVLNNKDIMFTTTNENNRYIRFKNVKANNNFRDVYFHDILLGGQNECIYEATNPYMIARAFRLAGDENAE